METGIAIKILYWAEQTGPSSLYDFDGIDDFTKELSSEYIVTVHGRPGDLGGGLNEFIIEMVSNVNLSDVAKYILEGVSFDLLKSGANAFVLRPFIKAYERLRDRNSTIELDISELTISFQDSLVKVYKIVDKGIFSQLEQILTSLAQNYSHLLLQSGERPFEVHIPLFEDPTENPRVRFRTLFDVDEPIQDPSISDYYKYWGMYYDYSHLFRVYDVERNLLIDEDFSTSEM